jgi:dienelactone hydrolase
LRHRVRGWNAELAEPSPVGDARWALRRIRAAHPEAPIALLGHSMGGRTAFAVADTDGVVGVCALAPWLPADEPLVPPRPDQRFVIAHGNADGTTSAEESQAFARRLHKHGAKVAYLSQPEGRHALLDQPLLWHRFATRTTLGLVGDQPMPIGIRTALDSPDGSLSRLFLQEFDE